MTSPSSRLLRLLSLLQAHREWRGEDLAGRLGVSTRTLRRDVDRVRDLGYVVDATPGPDGGYRLRAGSALPPLLVDDDEAIALAVAVSVLAETPYPGVDDAAVRALGKVVQVMPARLRRRVDAVRTATVQVPWGAGVAAPVDAETLVVVAQACRDAERLRFRYAAPGREPTSRHVEPNRLVVLGRRWYLAAYDVERADWRSFRLDRMGPATATGSRFDPRTPPGGDAAAFVRSSIAALRSPYAVEAEVALDASTVRARIGRWADVAGVGPSRSRVSMTADRLEWPALALGMLGAEFTVIGPPEFRDYLRAWAGRFGRAVPTDPGTANAPADPDVC